MKIKPFFFAALIVASFFSCGKDDSNPEVIKGSLSLNVGLFISVNEVENHLKSTQGAENFLVTIFNALGIEVMKFERASEIPDKIELEPGQYYVSAHSNNDLPAAFENPYYYGESPLFAISPGVEQSVTVNCKLANTMITIIYSDQVKSNFIDFATTISTTAGSLLFTKEEIRAGYFKTLPVNISVLLIQQKGDGTTDSKTLTGSIPNPQAGKKYEIHVDAASVDGSAMLQINIDETQVSPEIVYVTDTPVSGIIQSGDLLITEIMYDPDTLTDTEGEWFEIYNTTNNPIDLHQLVIKESGTDQHIINTQIILASHEYYVLSRTEKAVAGSKYIYGASISLNNTDAVLSLSNYGTDGTDGALIFSVNYGGAVFPAAKGASICLAPSLLNYSDAIRGDSWCVSVSEFDTGDLGTPGSQNDNCL